MKKIKKITIKFRNITGEAFFYAEVGQPSQVELFLFHGVRKTK
jgi:hypothetical protein